MRITDLFEHTDISFKDFVEHNEINYDLAEDLAFFMNNNDNIYRQHTYPAITKCLENMRNQKKTSPNIFKNAALESYKQYCAEFPIRELPSSLNEKMLGEVCKLIHDEVCNHETEGKYK